MQIAQVHGVPFRTCSWNSAPMSTGATLRIQGLHGRGAGPVLIPSFSDQDLLKHTPSSHPDHPLLQDALRISQNFLSSINEEITPRRQSMTVKKGEVSLVAELRGA